MGLLENFRKKRTNEAAAEATRHLKRMRDERDIQVNILVGQHPKVIEITNRIEENNTAISKLILANNLLWESRELHIKEVEENFEKEHPFDHAELARLENIERQNNLRALEMGMNKRYSHLDLEGMMREKVKQFEYTQRKYPSP